MVWKNTYSPPVIYNPIIITSTAHADMVERGVSASGGYGPGSVWDIIPTDQTRDIYIDGVSLGTLVWPLNIQTLASVYIVGLHIKPAIQPGNDVGDLPNSPWATYPNENLKPRWPLARALNIAVAGTTWIEGAYIECQGHNGDAIVWAVPSDPDIPAYNDHSKVFIVNSRMDDMDASTPGGPPGDDYHADAYQSQRGSARELYFENIVMRSGGGGVNGKPAFNAVWDRQEFKNISFETTDLDVVLPRSSGTIVSTNVYEENLFFQGLYKSYDLSTIGIWGKGEGDTSDSERWTPWNEQDGSTPALRALLSEPSPTHDFAPVADVGLNYVSPFASPVAVISNLLPDEFILVPTFLIENVDGDDDVYDEQASVVITCADAGSTEGIVEYGGIVQPITTWADETITITAIDAGALGFGSHDMRVFKPVPMRLKGAVVAQSSVAGDLDIPAAGYGDAFVMEFFIQTGDAAARTLTIPGTGGGYLYDIDWGDATSIEEDQTTSTPNHEYAVGDTTYIVQITGTFPRIYFNSGAEGDKLLRILNFGNTEFTSLAGAFRGSGILEEVSTTVTNTSAVTSLYRAFSNCDALVNPPDVSGFDTGEVLSGESFMVNCSAMTSPPDISGFDTAKMTTMKNMFTTWTNCPTPPDTSGSGFVTTACLSMDSMFYDCTAFTSPPAVGGFDMQNVTTVYNMLRNMVAAKPMDIAIDEWTNIEKIENFTNFLLLSELTTTCYDRVLAAWSQQTLINTTDVHMGYSKFTNTTDHTTLENKIITNGYSLLDGGEDV